MEGGKSSDSIVKGKDKQVEEDINEPGLGDGATMEGGKSSDSIEKGKQVEEDINEQGAKLTLSADVEGKGDKKGKQVVNFPLDLLATYIWVKLPIKSLLVSKFVNRSWKAQISDPRFTKLHFEGAPIGLCIRTCDRSFVSRTVHFIDDFFERECNKVKLLEPEFKLPIRDLLLIDNIDETDLLTPCEPRHSYFAVANSCNGLLCLYNPYGKDPFVICNPITGDFIQLPEEIFHKAIMAEEVCSDFIVVGFGFEPIKNQYKVIRIWKRSLDRKITKRAIISHRFEPVAEIHTLGTSTWRDVVGVDGSTLSLEFLTYLNGALHFISKLKDSPRKSILRFNLETESFESFLSHPPCVHENVDFLTMGELSGCIYLCQLTLSGIVTGWIMEKYGSAESWTKLFSVDTLPPTQPLQPWRLYWPVKKYEKGGPFLIYNHFKSLFIPFCYGLSSARL